MGNSRPFFRSPFLRDLTTLTQDGHPAAPVVSNISYTLASESLPTLPDQHLEKGDYTALAQWKASLPPFVFCARGGHGVWLRLLTSSCAKTVNL
jgi:hypothetical protein